jgi:hypothetical protein
MMIVVVQGSIGRAMLKLCGIVFISNDRNAGMLTPMIAQAPMLVMSYKQNFTYFKMRCVNF